MWNKYGNKKVETTWGTFGSKGELARWAFLKKAEANGEISDLQRQVTFTLVPPVHITKTVQLKTKTKQVERIWTQKVTYTADFVYVYNGETIVEDFKGMPNDRWPIKKALMAFVHGIYVREVRRPAEPIYNQEQ
jgi:hypothetical protein